MANCSWSGEVVHAHHSGCSSLQGRGDEAGRCVIMIGDGINDTPALSLADA